MIQVEIDVAGQYLEEIEEWHQNGLNGSIYYGQHIIRKLQSISTRWKKVVIK